MKYPIFLLGSIFSFFSVSAQTHDYTNAGCRYFICPTGQHCAIEEGRPGCPACRKDFDDEIKAVAEESKRKANEKAAQELVEKQKRDEEFKKINEQRKADENNKISIVSPQTVNNASIQKTEVKKDMALSKGVFYVSGYVSPYGLYSFTNHNSNDNNYFIVGKDTILKGKFNYCYGLNTEVENKHNFPGGIGIVELKQTKKTKEVLQWPNSYTYRTDFPIVDLVDSKGNRILNDDNITAIMHFSDNWFVLLKGASEAPSYQAGNNYKFESGLFYNIKTKESIPIELSELYKIGKYPIDIIVVNFAIDFEHDSFLIKRPTGTFKAALCTELDRTKHKYKVYYLNNDNKIDYDIIN